MQILTLKKAKKELKVSFEEISLWIFLNDFQHCSSYFSDYEQQGAFDCPSLLYHFARFLSTNGKPK